jgi:hypothetical protein
MESQTGQQVNALRSMLAIGAGFFAASVLPLIGDIALRKLMPESFESDGRVQDSSTLALILIYRTSCWHGRNCDQKSRARAVAVVDPNPRAVLIGLVF